MVAMVGSVPLVCAARLVYRDRADYRARWENVANQDRADKLVATD
jgi:hypothetical protein